MPSEQKPHGSGIAVAVVEDVETDVVRVGGRRMENRVVKSISELESRFDS